MSGAKRLLSFEQVTPPRNFQALKSGTFQTHYLFRCLVKMPRLTIQKYYVLENFLFYFSV